MKPGQPQADMTVINEGVEPGETVVVAGQLQLAPGTKVAVKSDENSTKTASGSRRPPPCRNKWQPPITADRAELTAERRVRRSGRAPAEGRSTTVAQLVQFSSGLSRPFIQRPVMTMLLTASIIVFGILTYHLLAVNDLPAVDYPVIQVNVSYPGANPETMANTIATPLEKQFTQIPGLDLTTSTSSQGSTSITLQFDLSKSIDAAATDVQSAIQRASGQLPSDLPSPPTFTKTNPNDQPVMYVALTSDTLSDGELYRYGTTEVSQRINILPGVSQVNIYGVKGAIRIKVDPGALAARNMTFDDLTAAIRAGTSYAGRRPV